MGESPRKRGGVRADGNQCCCGQSTWSGPSSLHRSETKMRLRPDLYDLTASPAFLERYHCRPKAVGFRCPTAYLSICRLAAHICKRGHVAFGCEALHCGDETGGHGRLSYKRVEAQEPVVELPSKHACGSRPDCRKSAPILRHELPNVRISARPLWPVPPIGRFPGVL